MTSKCCRCGKEHGGGKYVCYECSDARKFKSKYLSGRALAQSAVSIARSRGDIPNPATLICADCGESAAGYDHRDYNFPLAIEPVCRRCNRRRGAAIPKQWKPGEWDAYVASIAKFSRHTSHRFAKFLWPQAGVCVEPNPSKTLSIMPPVSQNAQ